MTKAKARQRAKAKAAGKARKRAAKADQPAPGIRAGQFNPKQVPNAIPGLKANIKTFGAARRGAARSR
ncbi:MAG: hypothetical protein QF830_06115 [Rhodospirillales bacterium]|jgi:hypothetical protein|nr:hypothetical protein [Rhodospirillales bacterium]MDP6883688.1 hypothetical protein [Rhodospirillales bacterium]